jgi:hypothetical protein
MVLAYAIMLVNSLEAILLDFVNFAVLLYRLNAYSVNYSQQQQQLQE